MYLLLCYVSININAIYQTGLHTTQLLPRPSIPSHPIPTQVTIPLSVSLSLSLSQRPFVNVGLCSSEIGQSSNIRLILVTLLTFHPEVSPLKSVFADMRAISVTEEKDKLLRDTTTIDSINIIGTNKHRLVDPLNSLQRMQRVDANTTHFICVCDRVRNSIGCCC